jgi:2-polyprenyl-3-methyl-5-hydroxy-6-metoxy-1,4-benzoquinol methylase
LFPAPNELKKYLGELRSCIICNGKNLEAWAKLDYLEAKKCKDCGMISVNPHLNDEGLSKVYQDYFTHRLDEKELFEKRKIMYKIDHDWITKFINHGKMLDVGCSGGQFLSVFDPKKWERQGVEIDKDAAEFAKSEYDIPVSIGYFPEISFEEKFDLVVIRGVIEHFSDPISVLKKCAEVLKPNGFLFITATPVGNSFAFDVYREKWHLFTPLAHIHFFTVDLLSRVLKTFGMSLIDQHYQYEETPYANPEEDFTKIQEDIVLISQGKQDQIKQSVTFSGSMMTAVWQKIQ